MPYTQEMFIKDYYPEWYQKIQSAKAEGEAKGKEKGKLIGEILLCQRLLKQSLYSQETLEARSVEELKHISAELQVKLTV